MSVELNKLKKRLAAATKTRKLEVANTIAVRRLEMQLARVNSPIYIQRAIDTNNTLTLVAILDEFEKLKTGTDNPIKPVFGFGDQVDKLLTIIRSIMYAKHEYRSAMEELAPIDHDLIEDTLTALGSPAYYSPKEDTIIEAIQPDLKTLLANVQLIASDLGMTNIKTNKITQTSIDGVYKRAANKANELMTNTRKYEKEVNTSYTA